MKHLMIISDGESRENSLHLTDRDRAVRLIALIENDDIGDGELSKAAADTMRETDEEGWAADYPEGVQPKDAHPEDYVDALGELLAANDLDLFLDDVDLPETTSNTQEVSPV